MSRIRNVKNTTKFKRSIKAISPVIATLLMIAIAVVASLVVYAWVTGYMGNTTSKAGKAIQIQSFAPQGNNLLVYVQNVGQGDVELNGDQSVYVNSNLVTISSPSSAKIQIPVGQTIELTVPLPAGYTQGDKLNIKVTTTDGTFMTTTGTGTSTTNPSPTTPPIQYQITVTQTANGVIAPGTTSYDAGSTPSFTITPNSGYHIASITANGGSVTITTPAGQTYQFAALSAAGTLTATYAINSVTQYQITVTQTANGVIAPGTTSYDAGSTPSFTITPNSGYHIASITANGGSVTITTPAGQTYQFAALSAAGTLTATYAINSVTQYQITVTQTANGVIAPGTTSYDAGSTPSFTITPNSGYHIASITANGGSVTITTPAGQTYQFAALSAAGTLTATYATNTPVTITLRPNAPGSTTQLNAQGTGTANWDRVDEVTSDGAATYVRGTGDDSWQDDTYNIPDQALSGTITNVRIYIVALESTSRPSDTYARTDIRIGTGSIQFGTQIDLTTSWASYNTNYATKTGNLGSGVWTWADINNLQIGVGLSSHDSSGTMRYAECTQVYVEITYIPA